MSDIDPAEVKELSTWSFPTRILFGSGSSRVVGVEAKRAGMKRALLVSDPGVCQAGVLASTQRALDAAGVAWELFSEISTNPSEAEVNAGAGRYRAARADGVVGVGGGAALDVAKLIVVRHSVEHPFEALDDAAGGDRWIPPQLPPVIAVPTTAGTGSEVGRAAVLTLASSGVKTVVFAPSMMPYAAVLDPELSVSLPPSATAATGFDALTHCFEAYMAPGDHPLADAIALGGLEIIARDLPRVVANGADLSARGGMLQAALMGATAFQKGLGACHSLSHPLSAELGVHHGLANALCLPAVVDFNERAVSDRVRRVGRLFGASDEPGGCGQAMRDLAGSLDLAGGLSGVGVRDDMVERLAELAFRDACHRQNPRACSESDFRDLYRASL